MPVQVAERIPEAGAGAGGTEAVAELQVQSECLPAVVQGLRVVPEPGEIPADRVERARLARPVAGRPVEAQGLTGMAKRLAVAALPGKRPADRQVRAGLASPVACFPVQPQGLQQVGVGLGVGAELDAGAAEVAVR